MERIGVKRLGRGRRDATNAIVGKGGLGKEEVRM